MTISVPTYPQTQLDAQICAQLRAYGLNVTPSSAFYRHLLFNGPVALAPNNYISRVKIDAYSFVAEHVCIANLTMGRYCTICNNAESGIGRHDINNLSTSPAFLFTPNFIMSHPPIKRMNQVQKHKQEDYNEVTLGHDVYIGPHACIINDVTIGTGAVIEAGSIITHDVPPYAIVSGVGGGKDSHGIIKGYRFSDEVISDLLELKWWEYDLPKLMASTQTETNSTTPPMPFEHPQDFIAFMRDSDTSTWPRLDGKWLYLVIKNSKEVQLLPSPPDLKMTPNYPLQLGADPKWG